jgi:hypothetical protein
VKNNRRAQQSPANLNVANALQITTILLVNLCEKRKKLLFKSRISYPNYNASSLISHFSFLISRFSVQNTIQTRRTRTLTQKCAEQKKKTNRVVSRARQASKQADKQASRQASEQAIVGERKKKEKS